MFSPASSIECGLCSGREFTPGPAGRLAATGRPPACARCGSLERHRALRLLIERLPIGMLSWRRGLQFSPDPAIKPSWFRSYELSVFDGDNSLDLQGIARADEAYDFITLNHVIEFVPDARASFAELIRVSSPTGLLQIGFSGLRKRSVTTDHASAQGVHGYFHLFGNDMPDYFGLAASGVSYACVSQSDPVTGVEEDFHFFSKSADSIGDLERMIASSNRPVTDVGLGARA